MVEQQDGRNQTSRLIMIMIMIMINWALKYLSEEVRGRNATRSTFFRTFYGWTVFWKPSLKSIGTERTYQKSSFVSLWFLEHFKKPLEEHSYEINSEDAILIFLDLETDAEELIITIGEGKAHFLCKRPQETLDTTR